MVVASLQPVASNASDGTTKASKTATVSDGNELAKLIKFCYDNTKLNKIVQRNSPTIHNSILPKATEKTIVAISATKIFVGIKFNIPEDFLKSSV